jgi:hypothetical protein
MSYSQGQAGVIVQPDEIRAEGLDRCGEFPSITKSSLLPNGTMAFWGVWLI